MKQTIRLIGAFALAALFLLAGCSGPFDVPPQVAQAGDGNGIVKILIGSGAGERTLLPETEFAEYQLKFTPKSGPTFNANAEPIIPEALKAGKASLEIELEAGDWEIRAAGMIDKDGELVESVYGLATVTVVAGKALDVTITLDSSESKAPGILKLSLQLPSLGNGSKIADDYGTAKITITPVNPLGGTQITEVNKVSLPIDLLEIGVGNWNNTNSWQRLFEVTSVPGGWLAAGELEIHPGEYTMKVELVSNRVIYSNQEGKDYYAQVIFTEYVYIFPDMVTATPEYVFEDERHFTDKLYFTGTAEVIRNPVGKDYIPTTIQVTYTNSYNNETTASPQLIPLQEIAEGVGGKSIGEDGKWELYINAKDIYNFRVPTNTPLAFRFVAEDGNLKVYSPWEFNPITNIQGLDPDFVLEANIFTIDSTPIASVPAGTTFVASNNEGDVHVDFAAGTTVLLAVTPPPSYGLIIDSLVYDYDEVVSNNTVTSDQTLTREDVTDGTINFSFKINQATEFTNSTALAIDRATFFQVQGILVDDTYGNKFNYNITQTLPVSVRYYGINQGTLGYYNRLIGNATVAANGTWFVPELPDWFKYVTKEYYDSNTYQLTPYKLSFDKVNLVARTVPPASTFNLTSPMTRTHTQTPKDWDLLDATQFVVQDPAAPLADPYVWTSKTVDFNTNPEAYSISVFWYAVNSPSYTVSPVGGSPTQTSYETTRGYNLYRDGTKLNTTALLTTDDIPYVDTSVVFDKEYVYTIETVNQWNVVSEDRGTATDLIGRSMEKNVYQAVGGSGNYYYFSFPVTSGFTYRVALPPNYSTQFVYYIRSATALLASGTTYGTFTASNNGTAYIRSSYNTVVYQVTSYNVSQGTTSWTNEDKFVNQATAGDQFVIPLTLPTAFDANDFNQYTVTASFYDNNSNYISANNGYGMIKFSASATGLLTGTNQLLAQSNLGMNPGTINDDFSSVSTTPRSLVVQTNNNNVGYISINSIVFINTANVPSLPTRNIVLEMYDDARDGWGGGALKVVIDDDDVNAEEYSPNSGQSPSTRTIYNVPVGTSVKIYWVAGADQVENAFSVRYSNVTITPSFDANNIGWTGTGVLVHKLRTQMATIADGTLLGSFTVTQ